MALSTPGTASSALATPLGPIAGDRTPNWPSGGAPAVQTRFDPSGPELGQLAFVPSALLAAPGALGTGAGAAAGTAGTASALPVLATVGAVVLLGAVAVWALTPPERRAGLIRQTLVKARGMLDQVPGLSEEQRNGAMRQISAAWRQGPDAVQDLAHQWRNGRAASPPGGGQPGASLGKAGRLQNSQPRGPREPVAGVPPPRGSAQPLSTADRRALQVLRSEAAQLKAQAQAGRWLTPLQLASGSLLSQSAQMDGRIAALLGRPGAEAHRGELTSLRSQLREVVAGLYRLTTNKAVAGVLTAPTAAGQQARAQGGLGAPYKAKALQQLLTQAQRLLTTPADAPLLAALRGRLAPQAPPPALLARESRVTHTGSVGTTEEIETRHRAQVAQALKAATAEFNRRMRTLLPGGDAAALAEAVYSATPELKALGVGQEQFQAHLKAGQAPEGASGARIRASQGGASGGGSSPTSKIVPFRRDAPDRQQMFDDAVEAGRLARMLHGGYLATPGLGLRPAVVVQDLNGISDLVDRFIEQEGLPEVSPIELGTVSPTTNSFYSNRGLERWHDYERGPLVVTDSVGKSYVFEGWSYFVEAKLKGQKSVNAHHVRLGFELELASPAPQAVGDNAGLSITTPTRQDLADQNLLINVLQDIDPRISREHIPEGAWAAVAELTEWLFLKLPEKVVELARESAGNSQSAVSRLLDNPETLRELSEFAISRISQARDIGEIGSRAGVDQLFSLLESRSVVFDWQRSITGNTSFQHYASQLRTSGDPVVQQIRRAIAAFLIEFYAEQSVHHGLQQVERLNAQLGYAQEQVPRSMLREAPESILDLLQESLQYLPLDAVTRRLQEAVDEYLTTTDIRPTE
jgi:hypothetical protein